MLTIFLFSLCINLLSLSVTAQPQSHLSIPPVVSSFCAPTPPARQYGHPLPSKPGAPSSSTPLITVNFVGDLQCDGTQAVWPVLNQVASHYTSDQVKIIFDVFTLPYHHQSWLANRAAAIVESIESSQYLPFVDYVFKNQALMYDTVTMNKTQYQMIEMFANWASITSKTPSNYPKAEFINKMLNDRDIEMDCRFAWKYECFRGSFGTPSFFVNNVCLGQVGVNPPYLMNYDDWVSYLDSLLY